MYKNFLLLLFGLLVLPHAAFSQATIVVTDDDVTGDVVWTNDNTYILDGRVFVEEGGSLTIEPGTVVKGRFNTDPNNASVLVVAPGAKIYANGTPTQPIIFTAEDDDVNDPTDLDETDRGLWGGVIILGNARLNVAGGTEQIEGIPQSDVRGTYGGEDDEDDSGVFRYVSIRHGGTRIAADNEINGLTMGGVGRGTTIEYVEVFANQDDGFEWFGGTVNTRNLVAAFCGDDSFDYDEGFRGKGQFWFAIQGANDAGSGGEFDGGTTPEDGQPFATPTVYNATFIGSGADSDLGSNDFAMNIRDNAGGKFYNSIFTDFAARAMQVEDLPSGEDSWARLQAGDLEIRNNIFYGFGAGDAPADLFVVANQTATSPDFAAYITDETQANRMVDPLLSGISRSMDGGLDPRPQGDSPAMNGALTPPSDGFFAQTNYLGAFDRGYLWVTDWTALSSNGYLTGTNNLVPIEEDVREVPSTIVLDQNYPNPFNPSTTITFSLRTAQYVRLSVHDILGRELSVIVDDVIPSGTHTARFDAEGLASGIYIYRMQTEGGATSKTMTLLK